MLTFCKLNLHYQIGQIWFEGRFGGTKHFSCPAHVESFQKCPFCTFLKHAFGDYSKEIYRMINMVNAKTKVLTTKMFQTVPFSIQCGSPRTNVRACLKHVLISQRPPGAVFQAAESLTFPIRSRSTLSTSWPICWIWWSASTRQRNSSVRTWKAATGPPETKGWRLIAWFSYEQWTVHLKGQQSFLKGSKEVM